LKIIARSDKKFSQAVKNLKDKRAETEYVAKKQNEKFEAVRMRAF